MSFIWNSELLGYFWGRDYLGDQDWGREMALKFMALGEIVLAMERLLYCIFWSTWPRKYFVSASTVYAGQRNVDSFWYLIIHFK
jgi:hypothetical protein